MALSTPDEYSLVEMGLRSALAAMVSSAAAVGKPVMQYQAGTGDAASVPQLLDIMLWLATAKQDDKKIAGGP